MNSTWRMKSSTVSEDMNFHEMTPVQEHTIPVILEGRDIIGCAQTGYGKDGGLHAAAAEQTAASKATPTTW